jgi:hypothetical protein
MCRQYNFPGPDFLVLAILTCLFCPVCALGMRCPVCSVLSILSILPFTYFPACSILQALSWPFCLTVLFKLSLLCSWMTVKKERKLRSLKYIHSWINYGLAKS